MGLAQLLKPAEKAIVNEMRGLIKSGAKPLYRREMHPARFFGEQKFDTWNVANPRVNTGAEPIGLYFAENIPEINPLLNPGGRVIRKVSESRKELYKPNPWGDIPGQTPRPHGYISGVLTPGTEHKEFSTPEWVDFIRDYMSSKGLPNLITKEGEIGPGINAIPTLYGSSKVSLAKGLTKKLADMGLDAVTFPDTIAGQPNLKQTVLLSHGNMLAKWGRDLERGAGVLGVAGLAAPKFFGWDSGKEQE